MSITSQLSNSDTVLTITINGRFDASLLDGFRESYENSPSAVTKYVVDLKRTEHLDSSALGMLLVLRDFSGGDKSNIAIVNASQEVKKIFTISSFEKLFDVQ